MKTISSPFPALHAPLRLLGAALLLTGALSSPASAATVSVGTGGYTQNFNAMTHASQTPLPGWTVRQSATSGSLGTITNLGLAQFWSNNTGIFRDVSAPNIPQSSSTTAQAANPDRVLALNQVQGFGDPGASFDFNFSSQGVDLSTISIDMVLTNDLANRSTTFTLQYGVGASPTAFTTLATWSDANVPSGFGSTTFTFDRGDFGSALDNLSQGWFRVVALTPSTGTDTSGARDQVGIDNFSMTATTPVPEPSTYGVLVGLGLALLVVVRRRQTILHA